MRGIKFRAWNKERKEMEYSFAVGANGKVFGVAINMGELRIQNIDLTETLELMQYTGLKDKNGKEIYEGDIIQNLLTSKTGVMFWDNERAGWFVKHTSGKYYGTITPKDFPTLSEVIGNIYENKELLDEKTV